MLTIIVKGTNGCNLACRYCSLGEKKDFEFISKDFLKNLLTYSCEFAKNREENAINFILHGGEPTLVDVNVYDECISYIKTKYSELNIKISMQSNGFLITDHFVEVIKKHDIHIGISIDGSEKIHDAERRTGSNQPSFMTVTSNIDKLLENRISVSCLMVLTQNALNEGFDYLFFFEERGLHLKINPLLNYGDVIENPELILNEGDYANYLIDLYKVIIEKDIDVLISPIDNIIRGIIHERGINECSFRKECNKNFLCIDYKGCLYPCGKFSDMGEMCMGNINETTFNKVEEFLKENLLERRNSKLPNKCRSCQYLRLCNGGCSAEAMIDGNFNDVPVMCKDYKMLFEYFQETGLCILREKLLKQKHILEEHR